MTTANSTGVRSGTSSSLGVRALSANRRRARVTNVVRVFVRAARGGPTPVVVSVGTGVVSVGTGVVMVVMGAPSERCSRREAVAGETEIDVVERRPASADRRGRDAETGDGRGRVTGGAAVHRNGDRCTDRERVGGRDTVRLGRTQRRRCAPDDA